MGGGRTSSCNAFVLTLKWKINHTYSPIGAMLDLCPQPAVRVAGGPLQAIRGVAHATTAEHRPADRTAALTQCAASARPRDAIGGTAQGRWRHSRYRREVHGESRDGNRVDDRADRHQPRSLRVRTGVVLVLRLRIGQWDLRVRLEPGPPLDHAQDGQGASGLPRPAGIGRLPAVRGRGPGAPARPRRRVSRRHLYRSPLRRPAIQAPRGRSVRADRALDTSARRRRPLAVDHQGQHPHHVWPGRRVEDRGPG
ncbi:hypothetical protein SCOCK_40256 [Actinacidiphila cocklensis]|uniref:Uncharacterized protein n=1 Tax=Actinacidiphila cocklensis TaxID=887465 RepID=A0A9W4DUU0_9ACTN|nr:hypothetical protein SCOCK_40256 [Actinacidiphila cocklensis]